MLDKQIIFRYNIAITIFNLISTRKGACKFMKKCFLALCVISLLILTACADDYEAALVGRWAFELDGVVDESQLMEVYPDGTGVSITHDARGYFTWSADTYNLTMNMLTFIDYDISGEYLTLTWENGGTLPLRNSSGDGLSLIGRWETHNIGVTNLAWEFFADGTVVSSTLSHVDREEVHFSTNPYTAEDGRLTIVQTVTLDYEISGTTLTAFHEEFGEIVLRRRRIPPDEQAAWD